MTDCIHHWLIDAPSGATSRGVRQKCGEVRNFTNRSPELTVGQYYSLTSKIRKEAAEHQLELNDVLYRAAEHAHIRYDDTYRR